MDISQLIAGFNPTNYGYTQNTDGSKPNGWYLNGQENPSNPYGGAFSDYLAQNGVGMWDPGNPNYGRVGMTNQEAFAGLYPGAQILGTGGQFGADPSLSGTQFFTSPNGATPNADFASANVWGKDFGNHSGIQNQILDHGYVIPLAFAGAAAGGLLGGADLAGEGGGVGLGGGGGGFEDLFGPPESAANNFFGPPSSAANNFFGPPESAANNFFGPPESAANNFFGPPESAANNYLGPPTSAANSGVPGSSGSFPSLPKGASAGTSALAKLLGISDSTAQLIGAGGTTLAGILGANRQADTLKSIFDQQHADRAPALAAFNGALTNPDSFYQTAPAMGAADAAARALSVQGNPAWNPGLSAKLAANNLGGYNSFLNNLAGPAFGGQSTQAQLGTAIAGTQGAQANAVAGGLGNLTTPTTDLSTLLKQLQGLGGAGSAIGALNGGGNA